MTALAASDASSPGSPSLRVFLLSPSLCSVPSWYRFLAYTKMRRVSSLTFFWSIACFAAIAWKVVKNSMNAARPDGSTTGRASAVGAPRQRSNGYFQTCRTYET